MSKRAASPRAIFETCRRSFHSSLCKELLAIRNGFPNIADKGSNKSKEVSRHIADQMGFSLCKSPKSGQRVGQAFAEEVCKFLERCFLHLDHLRPGEWFFSTSQSRPGIAGYEQYAHLETLQRVLHEHQDLRAALGSDYLITPDIIVARRAVEEKTINRNAVLVSKKAMAATFSPFRAANQPHPRAILHASISCKWTMRSDRAQNTRTEALNLIRNRKGNTPHIVVVTFEPLPNRIASLAMGTGDLDCTYHVALHELKNAVEECGSEAHQETLADLINGNRLRDISDLPFDLAV